MDAVSTRALTICGLDNPHHRVTLHFHDAIEPAPDIILPEPEHVEAVLAFGDDLNRTGPEGGHLLIHCHMGISRSTAAMTTLLAQAHPELPEDAIMDRLARIRPHAWPNSRMIAFADDLLSRGGRLVTAVRRLHGRQVAARPRLADTMRRLKRAREVDEAIRPE